MEHTRFIGLDIHKERISVAVAESGRSGAVEYLGEIAMNLAPSATPLFRSHRHANALRYGGLTARSDR